MKYISSDKRELVFEIIPGKQEDSKSEGANTCNGIKKTGELKRLYKSNGGPVPKITAVKMAVPKYEVTKEDFIQCIEAASKAAAKYDPKGFDREAFLKWQKRVIDVCGIGFRHSIISSWLVYSGKEKKGGEDDMYTPYDWNPPQHVRCTKYREEVYKLAHNAAEKSILAWGGDRSKITHVVAVTSTGWCEPGVACHVIHDCGLNPNTSKIDLNFNGCFAGVTAIRCATDIYRADPSRKVLVIVSECPSAQFNVTATKKDQFLSNLLFADAAGAAIISSEGEWELHGFGTYVIPDSMGTLTLHEATTKDNEAYECHLGVDISPKIYEALSGPLGKKLVEGYVSRFGDDVKPEFAMHPGGPAILRKVQKAIKQLFGKDEDLPFSYAALHRNGNLGPVSVLDVLNKMCHEKECQEDTIIAMGFGPGVTVEYGYLCRSE